jgi:hypothetical protein
MIFSLVSMAAGGSLLYLGIVKNYTLSIHHMALPQWTIYGAGGITALVGFSLCIVALRSKKCTDCNKVLTDGKVKFSIDRRDAVVEAVHILDGKKLRELPMVEEDNNCVILALSYCPNCENVAVMRVFSRENWNDTDLVPLKEISGNSIASLVKFVKESGSGAENL